MSSVGEGEGTSDAAPLRIAVWHNLPSGGGKRALHDHVKGLVARGHHVEAWCPQTSDKTYLPLSDLCTEHVVPLRVPEKKTSPWPRPFAPVRLVTDRLAAMDEHCGACGKEIDAGRFDVLFANTCTWFHSTPIARHVRLPAVLYLQEPFRMLYEAIIAPAWSAPPRGDGGRWSPRRLRRLARDAVAKHAQAIQVREEIANAATFARILVNSSFSRESVLRAYGLESRVSYLGIDLDRFRPTGEARENFVVALGGFDRTKGADRAVRALATIPAGQRPRFVWVANFSREPFETEVRRLAQEAGVEFELRVRVSDTELVSLLSRAAAMLYTPRLEPFGLAPLEANACGTPVVAVAEGGVRETIENGVNGLIAPDDDPAVLGRLVSQLTSSRERADAMGRRALELVRERWGVARSIDEVERHLREVLRGAGRAAAV